MKSMGLGQWGSELSARRAELMLWSFLLLPYTSYLAMVGLFILTLGWLIHYRRELGQLFRRQGWGLMAAGLVLSVVLAADPGRAALQSLNFLPFFLFFGGLSIDIPRLPSPLRFLEQWAFWLLMATIPINLRAAVEYGFKAPAMVARFSDSVYVGWLYREGPNYGHRADSVFGHPNVLAAYLVIIMGLGLGLCLQALNHTPGRHRRWVGRTSAIYGATLLIPLGVFCSGSRSGIVIVIIQLLVFTWLLRRRRWLTLGGLVGIGAVLAGVIFGGIGGRSLEYALSSSLLRVNIWQLTLPMIRQHPWLGMGLGSFQTRYQPYTIPDELTLFHAHNLWLNLAAEVGLPLMLLFTAIVGGICFRGVRAISQGGLPVRDRAVLTGYGLGFLACTLFSMFDIAFYDVRVNLLGWSMLAVLQAIPQLAPTTLPPGSQSPPDDCEIAAT